MVSGEVLGALDGNRGGIEGQSIYLWHVNADNRNQHWQFYYANDDSVNPDPVNLALESRPVRVVCNHFNGVGRNIVARQLSWPDGQSS